MVQDIIKDGFLRAHASFAGAILLLTAADEAGASGLSRNVLNTQKDTRRVAECRPDERISAVSRPSQSGRQRV